jgi:hypothetical protein
VAINRTPEIEAHVEMNLKTARNNLQEAKKRKDFAQEMFWCGKVTAYEGVSVLFPRKNTPRGDF